MNGLSDAASGAGGAVLSESDGGASAPGDVRELAWVVAAPGAAARAA